MECKKVTLELLNHPLEQSQDLSFLDDAIQCSANQVERLMKTYVHKYPSACSVNGRYQQLSISTDTLGSNWTPGFWTGMLWNLYQMTEQELFRAVAEAQFDDYKEKEESYEHLNHHDIGFVFSPSILAQYKITGSKKARELALTAADLLAKRYSPVARIIQVRDRDEQGNFIIDCSMNVPLLYWKSIETGDRSYYLKALNHMYRVTECMLREDASTYQCFKIDEVTGEPIKGWQGQGYKDESCWARGQAWVIYGYALSYKYTHDKVFLELAKKVSNYYLNRLPKDMVCNWDLWFTEDSDPRDSSTAPIAACGLLEIAKYLEPSDPHKQWYENAAIKMAESLYKYYAVKDEGADGLLLHGVYCKDKGNGGLGDDECCLWGDYFYTELLLRLKKKDAIICW